MKGDVCRSRIVGRQFAKEQIIGLFAPMPNQVVFQYFLSECAHYEQLGMIVVDVLSAFLQAVLEEEMAVKPPPDVCEPDELWLLHKSSPGLRIASKSWSGHQAGCMEDAGFERSVIEPCAFNQKERKVRLVNHGDDSAAIGYRDALTWFGQEYTKRFECKVG